MKKKIKLTEYQKNFLLDTFFENESRCPGWRGIATKLIETGHCIVAGVVNTNSDLLWIGGVGNFMKTEPAKDAIECTLYTFDLDAFMQSEWYKQIKREYVAALSDKRDKASREYDEVNNL